MSVLRDLRPSTAVLAALLIAVPVAAQQARGPAGEDEIAPVREIAARLHERLAGAVAQLDVDLIMEGADFSGTQPGGLRWSADGSRLWFQWKRWDEEEAGTWEYRLDSEELVRLDEEAARMVPAALAEWNRGRQRALWTSGDAVMLYDAGRVRPLIEGLDGARPVTFSGDGTRAVIRHGNDLLAVPLSPSTEAPAIVRLTDIRSGRPPDGDRGTDSQKVLREQQLALFDTLARRHDRREQDRRRRESASIAPLYLEGWEAGSLVPSPDLRWVVVFSSMDGSDARVADVPNYVTESGYAEDIPTRIKVGDELDRERVGILHVPTGRATWLDAGLEDRALSYQGAEWSDDSSRVLLQIRSQDNKDRWFAVAAPTLVAAGERRPEGEQPTGGGQRPEGERGDESAAPEEDGPTVRAEVVLAAHDHDDAWINWSVAGGWGWMPGDRSFYFVSERDGWMRLYSAPAGGGDPVALTSEGHEVFDPRLHPSRDSFVFEASLVDPFEVHAYRLPLAGGEPEQLTAGHGREDLTLSPDGSRMAFVASASSRPPELFVTAGVAARRVTESPSPAFVSYPWSEPEIVSIPARDGVQVPARLYRPQAPAAGRPAVIFVHGAGYLHNVHRWWSSYAREYAFHHLLMERGYTVLDIDYRGSAGYGRDWRTAISRHMGGVDLTDQIDGAEYLVREHGVDPERIGLYGGSYGGFITLMALFTAGDHFAAGAALRPVTDWAHYNHPYTSNILNDPQGDDEAYRRSSPIYFAEGLEDPLLIAHGVVDTNVHFQDVVRLAQRLIELRKENWELALYPVENHGFSEPASWADEYKRILALFERSLKSP